MFCIERIRYASAAALALLLIVPAAAADLQRPPPNYLPPPIWTGFHVGAQIGFAFSGESATSGFFGTPVTFSTNPSGVIGGLEAGYDYQLSPNWLVGAEAELSWSLASGNFNFMATSPAGAVASGIFNSNQKWYDTFTGRVGYLIDDWVLYAKAGAAWMNADYNLAVSGPFARIDQQHPLRICSRFGRRVDVRARMVDQARVRLSGLWQQFLRIGWSRDDRQYARPTHQGRRELSSSARRVFRLVLNEAEGAPRLGPDETVGVARSLPRRPCG
jgi:opacity protein-like surface antigen